MSSDKEQKSEGIVPLGNQGLARYSSDLIRKGLDLARTLEQSGAAVEAERQAIWIKPDAAKPLTQIWKCVHTLTGHSQSITSVAISPDGQTIVSGDEDGIIKLWHIQTGKLLHTLNIDLDSNSDCQVAISSDGQLLACFTGDNVKIWQFSTGELLNTLTHLYEFGEFDDIAFSPNGQTLATTDNDDSGPTLKIWNLHTGKLLRTYQGYPIAISPDWQTFASPIWNGIEIFNLQTGELVSTLNGGNSTSTISTSVDVAFSPDGQIFASGGWDDDCDCHTKDHTVKIWDLHIGELIYTFTHAYEVDCVAFSPDKQTLISVCYQARERKIKIWSLQTGELIHTLNSYSFTPDFTFSPDGQTLAVPNLQEIEIWHLHTGKLLCLITIENSNSVEYIAFSPDGQTLAVGCDDGTVKLWQLSPVEMSAEECYNRGLDRYEVGDAHGAIEDFNQALQIEPYLAEAYRSRGNARTALRNYQRATKDFQKAINLFVEQEKNANAYLSQGNAHYF